MAAITKSFIQTNMYMLNTVNFDNN